MDLARKFSPKDITLYLMDFGTNGLAPLGQLPQVADTLLLDQTEKIAKFSVDWKDGEGFIDCIAEMAQRFNVDLNWTEQQLEDDLPDQLARTVYPLFEAAGAVLYSVDTGSDYYTFIIIPQQDTADFEKVSKQYGVPLQRVNKII